VKFQYRDQVVVASGGCDAHYENIGPKGGECENSTLVGNLN